MVHGKGEEKEKELVQQGRWNSRLAVGESVVTGEGEGEGVEVLSPMK